MKNIKEYESTMGCGNTDGWFVFKDDLDNWRIIMAEFCGEECLEIGAICDFCEFLTKKNSGVRN
jgi:hypothetical protein